VLARITGWSHAELLEMTTDELLSWLDAARDIEPRGV